MTATSLRGDDSVADVKKVAEGNKYEASRSVNASQPEQDHVTMHSCPCCGKEAKLICTRCHTQRYCSRSCQQVHWKEGHKQRCQSISGRTVLVDLDNRSENQIWESSGSSNATWQALQQDRHDRQENKDIMASAVTSSSSFKKLFPLKVQVALNNPIAPMMCYDESRSLNSLIHYPNCKKARLLDRTIRENGEAGGAKAYFNASIRSDGRLVIYLDQRWGVLHW